MNKNMTQQTLRGELDNPLNLYGRHISTKAVRIDAGDYDEVSVLLNRIKETVRFRPDSDEFRKVKNFAIAFHENGWDKFGKAMYKENIDARILKIKKDISAILASPGYLPSMDAARINKSISVNIALRLPFRGTSYSNDRALIRTIRNMLLKDLQQIDMEIYAEMIDEYVAVYIEECTKKMDIEFNFNIEKEKSPGAFSSNPDKYGKALTEELERQMSQRYPLTRIYYSVD